MPKNDWSRIAATVAAMSVAALGAAAPALAQEQTPWSGWYLGGNIGGSWGHASLSRSLSASNPGNTPVVNPLVAIPPADIAAINSLNQSNSHGGGITGGIEGGYNYAMGNWLLGVETDFVGLDVGTTYSKSVQSPLLIFPPITYSSSSESAIDWMWTLRPRLGYAMGPWLFYGTVGLAVGNLNMSSTLTDNRTPQNVLHVSKNGAEEGWVAGAGIGYAWSEHWSAKAEWLYADFGSFKETTSNGLGTLTAEAKARPQIFRIGVDYKFGGPKPAPAPAVYAPPPAPAPEAPKDYLVFFDFDKSDLTGDARQIVDQAASAAKSTNATRIVATGHTDTVGSDAYNMRLSKRRAESVSAELQAQGIPSDQIEIVAKGKRDLLVPTDDGVREPQNRRVQIILGGSGSTS